MLGEPFLLSAVVLVSLTSVFILIGNNWRHCILALVIQYIGVFILVYHSWPIEMAIAKMVAGWMCAAILGISMASTQATWQSTEKVVKFGPFFRIVAAIFIVLTIYSLVQHSQTWLEPINSYVRWGSFILIGFGILQLSLTSNPLRTIIGLLTALSGYEVIYAAIETSTLVTGLLAGVNIGLALVGAYLLVAPAMESNP